MQNSFLMDAKIEYNYSKKKREYNMCILTHHNRYLKFVKKYILYFENNMGACASTLPLLALPLVLTKLIHQNIQ